MFSGGEENVEKLPATVTPDAEGQASVTPESSVSQAAQTFDEETMRILGIDTKPEAPALQLNATLAMNWEKWIAEGLRKDDQVALLEKYARTGNCNLEAPKLNAEVVASLFDTAIKRDKYLMNAQNIRGSAMSALGIAITMLLTPSDEGVDEYKLLECLADAGRLLAWAHRLDTMSRKALIIPALDKSVKGILDETKPGVFLFGDNLAEKIKSVKSIEKVGLELKSQPITQKSQRKTSSGNWKGPSAKANRGGSQAGFNQGGTRKFVRFSRKPSTQERQRDNDRDRHRSQSQNRSSGPPRGGMKRY